MRKLYCYIENDAPSSCLPVVNPDKPINSIEENVTIELCDVTEDELKNSYDKKFGEDVPLLIVVENSTQIRGIKDIPNEIIFEDQNRITDDLSTPEADYPSSSKNPTELNVLNEIFISPENTDNVPESIEINTEDRIDEVQKPTSKKRQKNPNKWKQNVRKHNRQHGHEYINVKDQKVPTKSVKENMCNSNEKCPFKCSVKISKEERDIIHASFWKLSDEKKWHFYSKHIKRQISARKRTKNETSRREYSYEYFFIISGVQVKVCQLFFLNTLNISKQRIYYFFKKSQNTSTDVPRTPIQGKHVKKKISDEKKNEVRAHIKSFPAVESHYCRSNTKKTYLERNLNMKRLYELYVQKAEDPVKYNIYETIFRNEFNISFFKPKKDICAKCTEYQMNKNPTELQRTQYNEHINRKNKGNSERNNDRSRYVNDITVGVVTFDLQNTFSLPKSNVSINFYKTKLNCYNLTAHLNINNTVYNSIWHEFLCGRGGVHIACALIKILKKIVHSNPQLKKLILWSDSCVPQNKNSIMACALQCFLNSEDGKNLEVIEQKFGEPGHGNVQEIDTCHSCIEKHLRNLDIWSPLTLVRLLVGIPKTWKLKFEVLQMQTSDYYDYQTISLRYTYNQIPFTKVKNLIYEKANCLQVKYRESFEGELHCARLKYSRRININPILELPKHVPQMNIKPPQVPDQKKKHLLEMVPQMPQEEKQFYYALLKMKNVGKKN